MKNWIGKNNPRWNGGRRIRQGKYLSVVNTNHPNADQGGYVLEHHLVMEKFLGRYLRDSEIVHHKNGDTLDNRLENLEIMNRAKHKRVHSLIGERTRFKKGRIAQNKNGKYFECKICEKDFYVSGSEFHHKFCSLPCYWQSKKGVAPAWLTR